MKIKLMIDPKYEETQIHICGKEKSKEIQNLYQTIRDAIQDEIRAYQDDVIFMLPCKDIIHIYTQDSKVYAATLQGTYRLHQRMYELEEQLDSSKFIRVSHSDIVNIGKIKRMDTSVTGTIRIHLDGEYQAYASRRYVTKIKKALGI